MRTIKYRTWIKDEKRWADHNEQLSEVEVSASVRTPSKLSIGSDRYELSLFTGLNDKNGAEIYEGDIIEWDAEEWGSPYREIVEWNFDLLSARQNEWNQYGKVIGNIYENPEASE
jgi:uncharacterized phage protein (TIGR01671 family)